MPYLWDVNRVITNEQPKNVPVRKSNIWVCVTLEFAISPHRYKLQEHSLPYQSIHWLKRKTPNVLSVVPAWARTHEAKVSPRTLGGKVAEEFRLMIAAALPTASISYWTVVDVVIPPTPSIFLHYQQKLTTPCTSLPPSELTQLQALCGTGHRAFVPPIDSNRADVVSLKRGRPIIRSVAKKKNRSRLAPAVQHPAGSLIIIVIYQFGDLGQPHQCILYAWFALTFMTFYLWILGKIPCHTDHINDFGINVGGR